MALFGITALGPPNIFKSSLASALGVTVFTNEEFEAAFKKFDKDGSGCIDKSEVEELLYHVYGFPPLEQEVKLFLEAFDLNKNGKISFEEFCTVLEQLREKCKTDSTKAKEYTSYNKLITDRFKHKRIEGEVGDKFKSPMTFGQTCGFGVKDDSQLKIAVVTDHRIKQCPETKYAAEMVRTGFI